MLAVGEWLASWYADDLPGSGPALQDRALQLRSAWRGARPEEGVGVGRVVDFTLGEPDVRHFEVAASQPVWLTYTAPGGAPLPTNRTTLLIYRRQ